ncbi:MAG: transposase [Clostridium sp.]|nr:transposase [Bacteroides sp.]MCM1198765.1 transposase [Clostridium sp.]
MRGEDSVDSIAREQVVHVFHVCTRGLESRMIFLDDKDYRQAVRIVAFSAFSARISVIAYCLMDNHVHVMLSAEDKESVNSFANNFKKEYSRYFSRRYSASKIFRGVDVSIKEMCDVPYMRNCIAYILRNPVEGGIVRDAGQYSWSSVNCYFQKGQEISHRAIKSIGVKECKIKLGTHCNLKGSTLMVDTDYNIVPQSFVNNSFVENLFNNSQEFFWNRISKVNYAQMEYDFAMDMNVRYNDYELLKSTSDFIHKNFGKTSITQLNLSEKSRLAGHMHRYYRAGASQIARLLGLDRKIVSALLGK